MHPEKKVGSGCCATLIGWLHWPKFGGCPCSMRMHLIESTSGFLQAECWGSAQNLAEMRKMGAQVVTIGRTHLSLRKGIIHRSTIGLWVTCPSHDFKSQDFWAKKSGLQLWSFYEPPARDVSGKSFKVDLQQAFVRMGGSRHVGGPSSCSEYRATRSSSAHVGHVLSFLLQACHMMMLRLHVQGSEKALVSWKNHCRARPLSCATS